MVPLKTATKLAHFKQIRSVIPRKRFDVDVFANRLEFRGKTVNFSLPKKSITNMFLLSQPSDVMASFIISLDKPLTIGKSTIQHLMFQFEKKAKASSTTIKATWSELDSLGLLSRERGNAYQIFPKVVSSILQKRLLEPVTSGVRTVHCSVGIDTGYIFFLDECCFFIGRKPIWIPYESISSAELLKIAMLRYFIMVLNYKDKKQEKCISFDNILKQEYVGIAKFLQHEKKVFIESAEVDGGGNVVEEDDEDDNDDGDDSEEEFDPEKEEEKEETKDSDSDSSEEEDEEDGEGSDDDCESEEEAEKAEEKKTMQGPTKRRRTR